MNNGDTTLFGENDESTTLVDLKDTVDGMLSADYKERFKAEYHQVRTRTHKLAAMLTAWDCGELNFTPTTPYYILQKQYETMWEYLQWLEVRAELEKIEL